MTPAAQDRRTIALILRILSVLSLLAGATIGFIEGFSQNPILNYPWGLPIADALISLGLAAWFLAHIADG